MTTRHITIVVQCYKLSGGYPEMEVVRMVYKTYKSDFRKGLVSIESAIGLMFSFGMFIIVLLNLVVLIINSTKK